MKKKREKKQRFWLVVSIIMCIGLILAGVFGYISSLRVSLTDQTVANVLTATNQQQQALNNFITEDRERLHSFTEYIALSKSTDAADIRQKLKAYYSIDAYYTVFNLEEGVSYGSKTNHARQMEREQLTLYRSFSGSGVRNSYSSAYTDETVFGYYECFTFADGVRGVFQKSYERSKISREFSLSFYNGRGLAYVVGQQGEILLRSEGMLGDRFYDNIFEVISKGGGNQTAIEEFKESLKNEQMGSKIFQEGEEAYLYTYVPLNNVEEWYLVSIVPMEAIMEEEDQILLDVRNGLLLFGGILAVCGFVLFLVWHTHRDIQARDWEIDYHEQMFELFSMYLSNQMDDVYLMLDAEKNQVEYVSPNVERVLGISEESMREDIAALGTPVYTCGEVIDYMGLGGLAPETTLKPRETKRVHQKTGEYKWFLESVYCTTLHGETKVLIYLSDRTQEQQNRALLTDALKMAQTANTAKSTFLSSISHDIRTPMNAIMGLVALLQDEVDGNEVATDYTRRIDAASQHLLGLINDVLDINKIESGNATQNISELKLSDIVYELNTIIRPQAAAKEQDFEILVSAIAHENLLGDKLRINQILINILSNAVKYTQRGGKIRMSVEELPSTMKNYSCICWTISDNGQGMSEEYQKFLFEPFTRENSVVAQQIQGTGLGMAITKSLVDLLGGTIQVKSKLDEGSTFTVKLELRIQDTREDPDFWKEHGVGRMIVADDELDVCEGIVNTMAPTGVITDYATDGRRLLSMVQEARAKGTPYDLLLLDWKMPDMDGIETARLIQREYPEKIPILLFTAYDWGEIEQEASEIGIMQFMQKPFFLNSFKAAIQRLMGGQKEKEISEDNIVNGMHILVVDDIEVNRMILLKILGALGASCDTAENGREAVEKFESTAPGTYDLLLMDVQMPVMGGYDATRAIRASAHPEANSILIIAMTANAFTDDIRKAMESGMNAHVAKPVQLNKLKAAIRQVLDDEKAKKVD